MRVMAVITQIETMYNSKSPQPEKAPPNLKIMAKGIAVANSRTPSASSRVIMKVVLAAFRMPSPNRFSRKV